MESKKTKSIKRSIATLTIFLLVVSAVEMLVSIQGSNSLTKNLKSMSDVQMPSLRLITLLDMMHDGLRAVVFNSILVSASKDEEKSKSVKEELKEFSNNFHEYLSKLKLLDLNSTIKAALEKVESPLNEYIQTSTSIVETALSGKTKEAMNELPNFQLSFKKLEAELEVLGELIEKEADKGKDQSLAEATRNDIILKLTALIGSIVGVMFFLFIARSTSKQLNSITEILSQNSRDVNSISQSLSTLSSHLSTSSQSQASSIQETASSLAEITSMMEKTRDSGNALKDASHQNLKLVEEGNKNVKEMNHSIEQIYQGNQGLFSEVEKSNAKFQEILELIKNIESKTKVINDIVFQTKLLSFNASVEAARAGEAGKGFAVVAEEVGNLASMSGKAAFEISGLINTSTQTVEKIVGDAKKFLQEIIVKSKSELDQGRNSTKKCQVSFEKIQESTNDIGKNLEEMIFAINEQSTGVVEINKATQELDKNTQVLAQEAHSLGQSVTQLNASAHSLENSIQSLHSLAGHSNHQHDQQNHHTDGDGKNEDANSSSESKILSLFKSSKKNSDHVA